MLKKYFDLSGGLYYISGPFVATACVFASMVLNEWAWSTVSLGALYRFKYNRLREEGGPNVVEAFREVQQKVALQPVSVRP